MACQPLAVGRPRRASTPDADEYGGDDWEFAYRAYNNGAVLVHDPARRRLARRARLVRARRRQQERRDAVAGRGDPRAADAWHRHAPGVTPTLLVTLPTAGAAPGRSWRPSATFSPRYPTPASTSTGPSRRPSGATAPPTTASRSHRRRRFNAERARWHLRLTGPARWSPSGLNGALAGVGADGCGRLDIVADDRRVLAELVSPAPRPESGVPAAAPTSSPNCSGSGACPSVTPGCHQSTAISTSPPSSPAGEIVEGAGRVRGPAAPTQLFLRIL